MLFPVPRTTVISELVIGLLIKFRRARSESTLQIMHRKEIVGPYSSLANDDWSAGDHYSYERRRDECKMSYQELAESFYRRASIEEWAASLAAAHRVLEMKVGKNLDFRIDRLVKGRDESAEWIVAASQIEYIQE